MENYAKLQKDAKQKQISTNLPRSKSKQNWANYNLTYNNYPWNIARMQSGKVFCIPNMRSSQDNEGRKYKMQAPERRPIYIAINIFSNLAKYILSNIFTKFDKHISENASTLSDAAHLGNLRQTPTHH